MKDRKTARRYAKVLFDLSEQQGVSDAVRADLRSLREALATSRDFAAFLPNHLIPPARRRQFLESAFRERLNPLTYEFIRLLEERRQLGALPPVIDLVESFYDRARGIPKVTLTVAAPLDPEQIAAIGRKFAPRFKQWAEPEVVQDPALVGGFKLQADDQVFDFSIATQLESLKTAWIRA